VQSSQINGIDRWPAAPLVDHIYAARFPGTRLNDVRSPIIQPTTALAPGLVDSTFTGRAAADIPWKEAGAYCQSDRSVSFAVSQTIGQNGAASTAPSPQNRELELLLADVYRDTVNPPTGYRVAADADLAKLGLDPSDLTATQSPFVTRIYVKGSGTDTEYAAAFRGNISSSDWGGNNWSGNIRQGSGLSSDHYRRALYIGSKLALASDANVTITGHTPGDELAFAAAIALGRETETFNSAGLSEATIKAECSIHSPAGASNSDDASAYYLRGDILSAIQDVGDPLLGGVIGGVTGAKLAGAPEAYGKSIVLDPVRPEGLRWYQDNPVARNGIDWVLTSLIR
jgi:hypothetical protein